MPESEVHPGSFVGDSVEEFKKLPTWGKALLVVGIGLGAYLVYKHRQSAGSAQSAASSALPTAAGTTSPFPSVNGLPLLPSSTNPIYDPNGGLVGYQNAPTPTTPPTAPTPSNPVVGTTPGKPAAPSKAVPQPGTTFLGPTGVNHYVAPGNQNLSQIANLLHLQSWNSIYAIPQNQQAFGALNSKQAAAYVPKYGQAVVIPASKSAGSGGPDHGMFSFMSDPLVYLVSAKPHTPSTVPGH
jgi:hypothetical protein